MARPTAIAADGNIRAVFATTLTTSAPTTSQLNAATDISFYLTPDGLTPSVDEQEITDDRLADTATFENKGRVKYSLGSLKYVINPASPSNNIAYTSLAPNTAGFIVIRWGVANATAWASSQIVDIWTVLLGSQIKLPPEANSVLHCQQKVFTTNTTSFDVAVA